MPPSILEEDCLTDQEKAALETVRQHLLEGRRRKKTCEFEFKVQMKDGGIMDRWTTVRAREK